MSRENAGPRQAPEGAPLRGPSISLTALSPCRMPSTAASRSRDLVVFTRLTDTRTTAPLGAKQRQYPAHDKPARPHTQHAPRLRKIALEEEQAASSFAHTPSAPSRTQWHATPRSCLLCLVPRQPASPASPASCSSRPFKGRRPSLQRRAAGPTPPSERPRTPPHTPRPPPQ